MQEQQKPLGKLENNKKTGWGGVRANSGRKPLLSKEALIEVKELVAQHSAEVDETDLEKRERVLVLMEILYKHGKKGNIFAVKEYLDRQMGKSKESLNLEGNIHLIGNQIALKRYGKDSEAGSE